MRNPEESPWAVQGARVMLVDPSVLGQSHLLVNLGMLRLCALLFNEVDVIAERQHCEALRKYGTELIGQVILHPYDSTKQISKDLIDAVDDACPILYLNLDYAIFLRLMRHGELRRRSLRWVLHSHFSTKSESVPSRVKRVARMILLFSIFPSAKYLVYGDHIRENLLRLVGLNENSSRVCAVVHPLGVVPPLLSSTSTSASESIPASQRKLRISYLHGWHQHDAKTAAALRSIEQAVEENAQVELRQVTAEVTRRPDGERILSTDYMDRIRQLQDSDLTLYLPQGNYSLQASGALMDAFVSGRPLVGLQADFAREVVGHTGPIGFLFDELPQLEDFLRKVDADDNKELITMFTKNLGSGYGLLMQVAYDQLRTALFIS